MFPYPPYGEPDPANITVPPAAAFIAVPFGAATSNPGWLSLDLHPNLDVIVYPEAIGFIKVTPKSVFTPTCELSTTFALCSYVDDVEPVLDVLAFFADLDVDLGWTYNWFILSSTDAT